MWTIIAAIVGGLVGFAAKIGNDIRTEHEARKAVAAALAGELGAYLRLSQPEQIVQRLRFFATVSYDERVIVLRDLFSHLPSGHPVFDRVADKIGVLSPEAAHGVSEAYNIVTNARLLLASLSSEYFLTQRDDIQIAKITTMTAMFAKEVPSMRETVALLNRLSRQKLWHYLTGRD